MANSVDLGQTAPIVLSKQYREPYTRTCGPGVIKHFFMFNSAEHEIDPANKC